MVKKLIIPFLALFSLAACHSIDYKPKYRDFKNAWEREHLIGNVKSIEQFKANVTDFKTGETEEPIMEFQKQYTDFGDLSHLKKFDNWGSQAR